MLVSHRADTQETDVENLSTIWHPTRDFLAVSNYKSNDGGDVGFFTKQGGKSFFKSKKKASARPAVIAWHNPEIEEICGMHWNSESGTLLVADLKSRLSIYRIDTKEFSKSKFLHKATIRDEIPQALAVKAVKLKPSSANFATRKLAKQEAFNEGDEMLLSALAETKRRTNLTSADEKIYVKDNTETFPVYFIGCSKGGIYSFDEEGNFTKAFQCDNGVLQILNIPESDLLVVSTDSMLFYQLTVENRRATEVNRVKLTGKKNHFNLLLIENSTVAMCYGEREIRIWDLKGGDNALFRLNSEKGYDNKDDIVCLSYSAKKNMISAGTSQGKIARWKRRRDLKNQGLDQQWKLQNSVETDCHIVSLNWSSTTAALVVNSINSVTIFRDEGIHVVFDQTYAAIQKSSTVISLIRLIHPLEAQDISLPFGVKGFRLSGKFITVWDEENVHIYEIKDSNDAPISITSSANFTCSAKDATVFGAMVIVLESNKLDIRTFQGTIRQTLGFREIEGLPILMDFNGKYMAVATTNGYLSVYDLSGKDIKQQFHSSQFSKTVPEFDKFLMIRVNSAGNRISFTATQRLSIWDGETDSVGYFSFQYGITDQQQYEAEAEQAKPGERPKTAAIRKIEREQNRFRLAEHYPGNHVWDKVDPRLLICEAIHNTGDQSQNLLISMYVTTEHGVQMHDLQIKSDKAEQLLHLSVPYMYFFKNMESEEEDDPGVEKSIARLLLRKTLREFVGLDENDSQAIGAMLDFSFYLCMGQMDNAFKSIKYIKNESVWDHMARMCVKTRRMDVARVCLGNMQNSRAARNVRLSIERGDSADIQAARLAIELGMIEEAKTIFYSIGRYDMINKILQTEYKWDEAFKIAEKFDRINLRNTYYNYAKYLEANGALEPALENYEMSGTQKIEVPRALFMNPKVLEIYVKRRRDPDLQKWWALYLESIGDIATAKNFYHISGEYLSVVRLLCMDNQLNEAAAIVDETGNKAAAFHLARQFELQGNIEEAVNYFSKAHAYGSAIKLAKEHDMIDKLANLALQAGGSDLVEAAKFYEERDGHTDKAVMLYHKAGMIGRALDLAFRTEQHSALDLIVQELNEKSDPRILERAAQFFAANQQDRKAIQLLAYAGKYSEAINLCRERNVVVNEELAELLTPPKGDKAMTQSRNQMLEEVAKCCLHQGNYHFAAKKFTQAGNKIEPLRY
uniref:Uncharacterized protein n=1 Tax=Panagrolaimus sp. PS1159 TaxID=55785 RepID=A0AC35F1W5_9BILA